MQNPSSGVYAHQLCSAFSSITFIFIAKATSGRKAAGYPPFFAVGRRSVTVNIRAGKSWQTGR